MQIKSRDGKYEYQIEPHGHVTIRRHGHPWLTLDRGCNAVACKAVTALLHEVSEMRASDAGEACRLLREAWVHIETLEKEVASVSEVRALSDRQLREARGRIKELESRLSAVAMAPSADAWADQAREACRQLREARERIKELEALPYRPQAIPPKPGNYSPSLPIDHESLWTSSPIDRILESIARSHDHESLWTRLWADPDSMRRSLLIGMVHALSLSLEPHGFRALIAQYTPEPSK